MKIKSILAIASIAIVSFVGGFYGAQMYNKNFKKELITYVDQQKSQTTQVRYTSGGNQLSLPDLTYASEEGMEAVVNIKTEYLSKTSDDQLFEFLFGNPFRSMPLEGTGSGVIISKDGYVVTNNHVVENATKVKVTLFDKREYEATVVGLDPSTDLAVLKINEKELKPIKFGNSDNLKIGQWVIAVGNPYGLNSTVTAGIVSAKARNISILKNQYAIESFIQTDAAVNPGNSGGALIDVNGNLVGINAAIASPTGSYTGYSFAIPVNLVQKIVADLIEFGSVQRAYLGVKVADIDEKIVKTYDLKSRKGVIVTSFSESSSAQKSGVKVGDVILKIDTTEVNSVSELMEKIGQHRPKDKVLLTISRENGIKQIEVLLSDFSGGYNVNSKLNLLGASFEDIEEKELKEYGLQNGVRVSEVQNGKFMQVGIRKGYIITIINSKPIKNSKDLIQALEETKGGVFIEGYYPDTRQRAYYAFGMK